MYNTPILTRSLTLMVYYYQYLVYKDLLNYSMFQD
uniref:Uncharacterized protein n=1 Tax=Podoviridae sp. ctG4L18 TaxID=2825234 RepID=A0A8S5UPM4_9CAUD|nr:MAG TPA: hypothetical protein [Podoviridae sp. ctG4L18]